jgi:serine protease Do
MFDESENPVVDTTATESMNIEQADSMPQTEPRIPRSRAARPQVTWGGVVTIALIFSLLFGAGGSMVGYFLGKQNSSSSVVINQPTPAITVSDKEIYSGVVDTVNKVSPAVVSINVISKVPISKKYPSMFDDFFGFGTPFGNQNPFERGNPEDPRGRQMPDYEYVPSAGSGVIIKGEFETGLRNASSTETELPPFEGTLILTNNHVIDAQNPEIYITLTDNRKFKAKVLASDPISDLAVLQVSEKNLPFAELGDSKALKVGEPVVAIGNALGELSNTVTTGVISALERNIDGNKLEKTRNGQRPSMVGIIQTDAAINPGNSGGPLVTLDGKVIGINTMIYANGQNLGFAVSSNTAKRVVGELLKYGKVLWPYLGVSGMDMSPEIAQELDLPNISGAFVARVTNGPARKAGVFARDIITAINSVKVSTFEQLLMEVRSHKVGEEVTLTVNRAGKELKLKLTLGELPEVIEQQ